MKFLNKSADNIISVMDEQPLPFQNENTALENYDIEFENVSFSYTGNTDVCLLYTSCKDARLAPGISQHCWNRNDRVRTRQKGEEAKTGMKTIVKYILTVIIAVSVVVASAVVPPVLAKNSDKSFLGIVKKDTHTAETYEYKATKYQKVRVLYTAMLQAGVFQPQIDTLYGKESAESAGYGDYGYQNVKVENPGYAPADSKMNQEEAKKAARRAIDNLGDKGAFPGFCLLYTSCTMTV